MLVGFIFSIHVASEYEKHTQNIRLAETFSKLVSLADERPEQLGASSDFPTSVIPLGRDETSLTQIFDAATLHTRRVLIVSRYQDRVHVFYRGYSEAEAEDWVQRVEGASAGALQRGLTDQGSVLQSAPFGRDPSGWLLFLPTPDSGPFIIDFVFHKLWTFLAIAVLGSIVIALIAHRFVRRRYDEVAFERARFVDFATSSSDWFWEMDENLRFSYFSHRFTEVTGVPQTALLGITRAENGNPGATDADWRDHLENLEARRPFRNFVHPRVKPNGSVVWLSINGTPVFENGRFRGYRGTGSEITEQRELAAQLIALKEEAERANAAKSQFLANMSHELRTPLNAILGYSEMLSSEMLGSLGGKKNIAAVEMIHQAGSHLAGLISDILDVSRIEIGALEIEEETLDVRALVDEVIALVRQSVSDHRIQITTRVPETLPPLFGDRRRIKQVLLNLLNNAIKFTAANGAVRLDCAAQTDVGMVISVSDTGIGIGQKDIPRILEPFGQVADAHSRDHGGVGLGLPICSSLMALHDGTLTIESELNVGTTVRVHFPTERVLWEGQAAPALSRDRPATSA